MDINGYATGALHVFSGDAYGAVCSQSFDNKDADVACRQLGFVGGSVLRSLAGEQGSSGSDFLSEEFRSSILKVSSREFCALMLFRVVSGSHGKGATVEPPRTTQGSSATARAASFALSWHRYKYGVLCHVAQH